MSSVITTIFSRRILVTISFGIASGIPLLATSGTLQAWLKDEGVDLTQIGLFALVGLPYTVKFLWAPLMDRFTPPFLGRRRGWILINQIFLILSLVALSMKSPGEHPWWTASWAFIVCFFSAGQDIVLDAHRRDTLHDSELGLGSSFFVNGYRVGMLLSGAVALMLADIIAWNLVYLAIAASLLVGVITVFIAPEPELQEGGAPVNFREAVIEPLVDYFKRSGAIFILLFILLYRIGDSTASAMLTPFVLDIGFSKTELAAIAKTFGLFATISGGILGGILLLRMSLIRALFVFGTLQLVSNLGFCLLASVGPLKGLLALAIGFENFSGGLGTAAYVAYMASLCNRKFSATQYALLSSLVGIPRVLFAAPTGWIARVYGWEFFFIFCTLLAIPGLLMIRYLPGSETDK